jgi:CubicO group peptidase (beta-lactamase class C family)/beta-lactamase regulating signal transducer with metallopeptidase domain
VSGQALLSAVSASLWLGALLIPAALLVMGAWPRLAARRRFALWWAVLVTVITVPWVARDAGRGARTEAGTELTAPGALRLAPEVSAPVAPRVAPESSDETSPASSVSWSFTLPAIAPRWFLLVWGAGALIGLLALLRELALLSSIRRNAEPPGPALFGLWRQAIAALPTRRVLRLLVSDRVPMPAACGYNHPAVLVPSHFEDSLDADEMRHLLLHELAHLERRDDWSLAVERVIRVLCWWHPAVWWIGRRLDAERELACDDAVASRVDRRCYARTLVRVAELAHAESGPALAPGAARGTLARRVESLVRPVPRIAVLARASAASGALLALAGVGLGPPALRVAVRRDPAPTVIPPSPMAVRSDASGSARGDAGLSLDSLFTRFADSGFSGTVLVAFGDQVVLEKGYGLADREKGIPATAETRYSAAGITKLFTAAAVLTLESEGRLSIEDPVSRWTGEMGDGKDAATLHQLLTHTDGLTRQSAPVYRESSAGFVRAVGGTPSAFAPGTGYRYNDFGHSLLGVVVEKATGESYEDYIRHRFLKSAGLKHTGFESDRWPIAIEYGGDRAETRLGQRAYVWGRRGSLGLVTTAGDLYRWFRAMDNPAILPASVHARMLESHVKTDWGAMQGYGWDFHYRADGRVIWRRVAGTPGFEGEILHDPAGRWTAVILVNSRIGWRFKVWDAIERAALLSAANR